MHADVAHDALDTLGQRQQLGDFLFVLLALLDLGRFLARIDEPGSGLSPGRASVTVLPGGAGTSLAMLSTWP